MKPVYEGAVYCGGLKHRVGLTEKGRLVFYSHERGEVRRLANFAAVGGDFCGCARVLLCCRGQAAPAPTWPAWLRDWVTRGKQNAAVRLAGRLARRRPPADRPCPEFFRRRKSLESAVQSKAARSLAQCVASALGEVGADVSVEGLTVRGHAALWDRTRDGGFYLGTFTCGDSTTVGRIGEFNVPVDNAAGGEVKDQWFRYIVRTLHVRHVRQTALFDPKWRGG